MPSMEQHLASGLLFSSVCLIKSWQILLLSLFFLYVCTAKPRYTTPMNRISTRLLPLKRWLVRIVRWPKRYGFGVHSPFAYRLITNVINEHTPYYSYNELRREEKRHNFSNQPKGCCKETLQMKRLLYRLVNYVQPVNTLSVGCPTLADLYLVAAKREINFWHASSLDELFLDADEPVDFLYLHDVNNPGLLRQTFELCARRTTARSLFVVQGVGYCRPMRQLWQELADDPRVAVTFDLFDFGLLFFDHTKQRQHYKVSF